MTISPARATPTPASPGAPERPAVDRDWWRTAVIYQVYVRSFADGDGDGIGDLAGVRSRLDYLQELGVDALWFTPWYASPLVDGGYDVADYRRIHPDFGELAEAEALIAEASERGIRTIIDIVPNHVSDRHRWFQEALAAGPGSPERERFWFRDGRGEHGELRPNDWPSSFSGDTWTRVVEPDGTLGQWYLHLFTPEQPDLNWEHPEVRREHEDVLRFWFDRGVAGVRIDSAALVAKDPALPEIAGEYPAGQHPNIDRDELHEIYRGWRGIAESYPDPRVLIGEVWVAELERFALYLRPDEMNMAFNFDFMTKPWDATTLRASIEETLDAHAPVGAPATWVLSNHDITRPVTRYGREDSSFAFSAKRFGTPSDEELGLRRARAAALLVAALPGALYIYQGDELGLPEAEVPRERIEDPMHFRSEGVDPGRDGCRVPLPWSDAGGTYGFGPSGARAPWLPQPDGWGSLSVAVQAGDPSSTLALYRRLLRLRREHLVDEDAAVTWLDAPAGVLAFARGEDFISITNLSSEPVVLPERHAVLLRSDGASEGHLLPDSTAWLTATTRADG